MLTINTAIPLYLRKIKKGCGYAVIDVNFFKDKSDLEKYEKGKVIVEEGETTCDSMYILVKGEVNVYKSYQELDELMIATLKPGDFFGEMSLFMDKGRTATVVAREDVMTLTINKLNAYDFFEKYPEMAYSLIKALCYRLESTNAAYQKLYSETHPENIKGLGQCHPSLAWLFIKEHKNYRRNINIHKAYVSDYTYKCPHCGEVFSTKASTNTMDGKHMSFERPASGRNSFYYDVVACPKCWYSTLHTFFDNADKKNDALFEKYYQHKPAIEAVLGDKESITGVFVRYYFALRGVPKYFSHYEEMMAKLWVRVSWLYYDCKDEKLEQFAIIKARDAYIAALQKGEIPKGRIMPVNLYIGELSLKVNDLIAAKNHFRRVEESGCDIELRKQATERGEHVRLLLVEQIKQLRAKN